MRKRRYNKNFVAEIERVCLEKYEEVQLVDEHFYDTFLTLSDGNLRTLVQLTLESTYTVINRNVLSGKWQEEDLYEHFFMYLELIFEGKVAFRSSDGKMCFLKPLGNEPSDDLWEKLQSRIQASRPVVESVLREALAEQPDNKKDFDTPP